MGPLSLFRVTVIALAVVATAGPAAAQSGRVGGVVKDDSGRPIKGATVRAENPNSAPSAFTASTDDKGRFSIIGLRSGAWTFTAEAPGFTPEAGRLDVKTIGAPNPPLTFALKKGVVGSSSALGNLAAKDLQAELGVADQLFNAQKWDEALSTYKRILAKAPALSVINLQIAAVYRNQKAYDSALWAYSEVLKTDPNNEKAKVGIGMTNLEKGDLKAAEETLAKAAKDVDASREVLYSIGEAKFAKGEIDEAAKWYQKAADADSTWGKPLFKLGLVALSKGDKNAAIDLMDKAMMADPASPEAVQAKAVIDQLKK